MSETPDNKVLPDAEAIAKMRAEIKAEVKAEIKAKKKAKKEAKAALSSDIRVKDALIYFKTHARKKSWALLAVGIFFALLYAVGTVGLAKVIEFLSMPDVVGQPILGSVWAMLAAFCLRPVFYVCHIQAIARSVLSLTESSKYSRMNSLMLRSLIILTRDVPTLIILLIAIAVIGKGMGVVMAGSLLCGLFLIIPARRRAKGGKIAEKVKAKGHRTDAIQRRVERTWAEASTDISIAALLVVVFLVFMFGPETAFNSLAAVIILGFLLLTPLRRVSRLLVDYK